MTLEDCRRFYAEEIRLSANIRSEELINAFAKVPRENFLGPGPWKVASVDLGLGGTSYAETASADPRHLYHNVPVALDSGRELNNGQPAALAKFIEALDLRAENRLFHLGCGVGYYTAIMAEIVGSGGTVIASEIDEELAARARQNLKAYPNVSVQTGDGMAVNPGPCDAILINVGVTHPSSEWIDSLREGGRLVLPLTVAIGMGMSPSLGKGVMARITREAQGFSARMITFVAIYSCTAGRDPQLEPLLGKALATGALMKMKSLRRDAHEPADTCLLHCGGVCLSTVPLQEASASREGVRTSVR
jgi:protein-L-isoaspartate(D-aspartate) O-methyltransferase